MLRNCIDQRRNAKEQHGNAWNGDGKAQIRIGGKNMEKELYQLINKAYNDIQSINEEVSALSTRMELIENELSKISDKAFDDFKRQFED